MKKRFLILLLSLCLFLCSCSAQEIPQTASDGTPWSETWITLGNIVGVESMEGWVSQRNEDVLAAEGMFFASWTYGTAEENTEGESVYPAQIFLVVSQCPSPDEAGVCLSDWQELICTRYITESSFSTGDFTMTPYRFPENSGYFTRGITALGIHGSLAINAELSCREDFSEDPSEILTTFLEGIHYAD